MTARVLDTLAIAGKLKAAGFSELQAETMTFVLRDASEASLSDTAMKADLGALRTEVQTLGSELRAEMHNLSMVTKADLQSVKAEVHTLGAELRAKMQSHRMEAKADLQAVRPTSMLLIFDSRQRSKPARPRPSNGLSPPSASRRLSSSEPWSPCSGCFSLN